MMAYGIGFPIISVVYDGLIQPKTNLLLVFTGSRRFSVLRFGESSGGAPKIARLIVVFWIMWLRMVDDVRFLDCCCLIPVPVWILYLFGWLIFDCMSIETSLCQNHPVASCWWVPRTYCGFVSCLHIPTCRFPFWDHTFPLFSWCSHGFLIINYYNLEI